MSANFDPYQEWLGIPKKDHPLNLYRLLDVELWEQDQKAIDEAASRRRALLEQILGRKEDQLAQKLLAQVEAARSCLLDSERRAAYDKKLKARMAGVTKPSPSRQILKAKPLPDPTAPRPSAGKAVQSVAPVPARAVNRLGSASAGTVSSAPRVSGVAAADPKPVAAVHQAPRSALANSLRRRKRRTLQTSIVGSAIAIALLCVVAAVVYARRQASDQFAKVSGDAGGSVKATGNTGDSELAQQPLDEQATAPATTNSSNSLGSTAADENQPTTTAKKETAALQASNSASVDAEADRHSAAAEPPNNQEPDVAEQPGSDEPPFHFEKQTNPGDEPEQILDPVELLAAKGLTREGDRWLITAELQVQENLTQVRGLQTRISAAQSSVTQEKLDLLGSLIRQLNRDEIHLKLILANPDRGVPNQGRAAPDQTGTKLELQASLKKLRPRVIGAMSQLRQIQKDIASGAKDMQRLLTETRQLVIKANADYEEFSQDASVTGSIQKLGGALERSADWDIQLPEIEAAAMSLPQLSKVPQLSLKENEQKLVDRLMEANRDVPK